MKNRVLMLRKLALLEGISFLVLLGIAMPLKYIWGQPIAVKICGLIHGLLFVLFVGVLLYVTFKFRWPLSRAAVIFFAALIPFGPWIVDKRMLQYADAED
jgi:integral membrane protein